jgi:hypothetical protein
LTQEAGGIKNLKHLVDRAGEEEEHPCRGCDPMEEEREDKGWGRRGGQVRVAPPYPVSPYPVRSSGQAGIRLTGGHGAVELAVLN